MRIAQKTKQAIEECLVKDQGALYRKFFHEAMVEAVDLKSDAFRDEDDGFRSHLGASLIGRECPRELWYTFRWTTLKRHEGRMVRLFHRGHLEEPRFVALLRAIGCTVWQYDQDHHQFRVAAHDGHFGGSLDSVIQGCPDIPDQPILGEFKTHSEKSFEKLVKEGVRSAKPEHWVQQQVYMAGYALHWSLYMAVNKNNDDLHMELIQAEPEQATRYFERAGGLIQLGRPPHKISPSPGWFGCKFCDHKQVCHHNGEPARNCRTCIHSSPVAEGGWYCQHKNKPLSKADQIAGCFDYRWIPM